MASPRHFLDLESAGTETVRHLLDSAHRLKKQPIPPAQPLKYKSVVLMFEKNSTRTRLSFDVGVHQLGGHPITINTNDTQLGRGESIADTARTISRYADAIVLRSTSHKRLLELAEYASVPVINGLTDHSHPCQVLADIVTLHEHSGGVEGKTVAWVGDANNVCFSWMQAACMLGFTLKVACPPELTPNESLLEHFSPAVQMMASPEEAVEGADCVTTDTWISMGNNDIERRRYLLAPYQVTSSLMALAKPAAVFMHCLPATRGQEVTENVIDGQQSVVWEEAANRLHVQKAILCWCFGHDSV